MRRKDAARCASAASLLLLGGCNLVVTQTPLFAKADAAGAPPIRGGIWNGAPPDCKFDETLPQSQWPKCANAQGPMGDPPPWLEVAGDPVILQFGTPPDPAKPTVFYIYIAVHPLKLDDKGRVVAIETWPVQCGPPPPKDDQTGMTRQLLPGLTPRKDLGACTTTSREALLNAAKASRVWVPVNNDAHWVRDPIPGDLTGPAIPSP